MNVKNIQMLFVLSMSYEVHFERSGCVNKQNLRQQSEAKSNEVHVKPLHGQRVTVWSGISEFSITDCFEDETGNYVSVTSDRYVRIADEFLVSVCCGWRRPPTAH